MRELLAKLVSGRSLTVDEAVAAFRTIMTGQASAAQMGAMLALIEARGATIDEIVGAATVMRQRLIPVVPPPGLLLVDNCGTGGAGARTFNISTTAALVAAAVGRPRGVAVAKHGNRSVTSVSGSSQVLEALGVRLPMAGPVLARCLDEAGFCFCFAPAHHPAMKHAAPVRAELGFRTLFNLLGPLANPAGVQRQVMGVFSPGMTEPIAQVLKRLGTQHALVLFGRLGSGADQGDSAASASAAEAGIGELSTLGHTRISELKDGQVRTYDLDPRTLGFAPAAPQALYVPDAAASAALVRRVLDGTPGPARDIVCLNAAAVLMVGGVAASLAEGIALAGAALDDGAARAVLAAVARISREGA